MSAGFIGNIVPPPGRGLARRFAILPPLAGEREGMKRIFAHAKLEGGELDLRFESGESARVFLGGGGAVVARGGSDDMMVFDSWEEAVKAAASVPYNGGVVLLAPSPPEPPPPGEADSPGGAAPPSRPRRAANIPAPVRLRSYEGVIETGTWRSTVAALVRELNRRAHDTPAKWAATGLVRASIPDGAADRYEKAPGGWVLTGLSAKGAMETMEKMVRDFGYKPTRWTLEWEDGTVTHIGTFHPALPAPEEEEEGAADQGGLSSGLLRNAAPVSVLPPTGGPIPAGSWKKAYVALIRKLDAAPDAAERWAAFSSKRVAPDNPESCVKVKGGRYVNVVLNASQTLNKMAAVLEVFGHSPSDWRLEWEDGTLTFLGEPPR